MRYFPLFIDLANQTVVIVGEGEKAIQKLRLLAKSEARIRLVSRSVSGELGHLAAAHGVNIVAEAFAPEHLDGARLAIVATEDEALGLAVSQAATARGIPVNVVDRPELGTFVVPALVDRDPIMVAIGSEGTAPVLARDIRARIEALLPARIGAVAREAAGLRGRVRHAVAEPVLRKRLWERLLRGAWRDCVLDHDVTGASRHLERELATVGTHTAAQGRVSLVGAGPGDPDLLTLRAQQRLQEADVIVMDGLVTDAILEHARRDARRIHVGKKGYGAATSQDDINRLLVREAAMGQKVVRLKGGDPFIFGRAAEEVAALRAAGIGVDIVPGITAAHACAASIGLPITLREKVRQFSVVTGTTDAGLPDLDWQGLARPGHAFAIYMGVRTAPAFTARLLAQGARADLPVVVVENGTRPDERVMKATLETLPEVLVDNAIQGPAVIFVGLDWADAYLSPPERLMLGKDQRAPARETATAPGARAMHATSLASRIDIEPHQQSQMTPHEIALKTFWIAG